MDTLNNNDQKWWQSGARPLLHAMHTGIVATAVLVGTQTAAHATAHPLTVGDYTGDHKTDVTVYRPSNGTWYTINSATGVGYGTQYGLAGDVPVSGDFRYGGAADGKTDPMVFRPSDGTWHWIDSVTGVAWSQGWGGQGDIPAVGDYDGDGLSDITVWRRFAEYGYPAGTWWVINSHNWSVTTKQWGGQGDIPVSCDYDGDGKSDYAVFRPSNGTWYIIASSTGSTTSFTETWGQQGDIPAVGDYDGDGKCDKAIFRPSTGVWWVTNSTAWTYWTTTFGQAGDVPTPGDYDGDGKTDVTLWRPSNYTWSGLLSGGGSFAVAWGSGGPNNGGIGSDVPLPNYPGAVDTIADVDVPQQQSNWCWAATTQMAAAFSQVAISQCQEANVNVGRTDCCTNSSSASDTSLCNQGGWWTLTSHGFTETDLWYSAISFTTLQNELNASRPVPFAWAWMGTGGHAQVAMKTWVTSTGAQWVSVNNPDPVNVGEQDDMLYSWWVSGANDHTHWRDSYNVVKP